MLQPSSRIFPCGAVNPARKVAADGADSLEGASGKISGNKEWDRAPTEIGIAFPESLSPDSGFCEGKDVFAPVGAAGDMVGESDHDCACETSHSGQTMPLALLLVKPISYLSLTP